MLELFFFFSHRKQFMVVLFCEKCTTLSTETIFTVTLAVTDLPFATEAKHWRRTTSHPSPSESAESSIACVRVCAIGFTFNGLHENRKITAPHVQAHVIEFNANQFALYVQQQSKLQINRALPPTKSYVKWFFHAIDFHYSHLFALPIRVNTK